jgi:hypothetical protein
MKRFRIQTPAEREELRLISQLQWMNCYPQLVRRLTEGESANSVARWASGLGVDGAAGYWSPLYWRKHITVLGKHVRLAKDKLRTRKPVLPKPEDVAARVEMEVANLLAAEVIPKSAARVGKHVEKALKEIDGHRALKYAALQQIGRIEKLKELEKKLQRPMRNGHKEIDALRKIAESIHEIEVGEQWLRGKGGKMPMTIPAGKRLK